KSRQKPAVGNRLVEVPVLGMQIAHGSRYMIHSHCPPPRPPMAGVWKARARMRITNLNPDTAIGASAWFVEIEDHRLLMDAGVHPKREGREALPIFKLIKNEDVEAIAISHCHHDHVGSLPVALRYFPKAHVLMSELSYFLVERVLHNSVNVMTRQRN